MALRRTRADSVTHRGQAIGDAIVRVDEFAEWILFGRDPTVASKVQSN